MFLKPRGSSRNGEAAEDPPGQLDVARIERDDRNLGDPDGSLSEKEVGRAEK